MGNFLLVMLALMMFTMGLSLTFADFSWVMRFPTAALLGCFCQLLLLPAIGWVIVLWSDLPPVMALGLMLICLCPGGVLSNYISFMARGDVALSVSLTVISSFITVFSVPVMLRLVQSGLGATETEVQLPVLDTMQFMAFVTVIPVGLGMLVHARSAALATKLAPWMSRISSLMLFGYILYSMSSNSANIVDAMTQTGGAVVALLLLSALISGALALAFRLSEQRVITLVIETGLQNSALAFTLAIVMLKNEALIIPNLFYSAAMFVPAFAMVALGRWRAKVSPTYAS